MKKKITLFLLITFLMSSAAFAATYAMSEEVAFISSSVKDSRRIVDSLGDNVDVVYLDLDSNALDQITKYLAIKRNVSAIHVISHGNDGYIVLNGAVIDADYINEHSSAFAQWQSSLTPDADILLYGCKVAESETGKAFISQLAEVTGADVAASTNVTGVGNDWNLEYHQGTIEAGTIAVAGYDYHLATWVVTSNADDGGTGTLRYIIANCSDGDEITFNLSSGNETITLGSEIAVLYSDAPGRSFNIDGANTAGSGTAVTIQVTNPGVSSYKVFMFNPGTYTTINLSNMTLKGGDVTGGTGYHSGGTLHLYNLNSCTLTNVTIEGSKARSGGGIYVFNSPLIMNNCTIANTEATENGGGIYNGESLIITSTTISNCSATSNGGGLAIYCPTTASDIIVENCTAGNYGGGIHSQIYNFNLTSSEITNNGAGSDGGGIYCSSNGSVTITKSVISDNSSTGKGGGLYTLSDYNTDQFSINNSTISNNSADSDGGGIYAYGMEDFMFGGGDLNLILINSTVTGNTTGSNGGGIYAYKDAAATNDISLTNSIVTYNAKSSAYEDVYNSGATFYGNYNIIGGFALSGSNNTNYSYTNGYGETLFSDYTEVSANSIYKPVLADNGGDTETVALASNSIAVNSGVKTGEYESSGTKYVFYDGSNWVKVEDGTTVIGVESVTEITIDQRGESRNDPPTIGAYEYISFSWDGSSGSSWDTGDNWDSGSVPTATDNVIIPAGLGTYPTLSSALTCNNFTIESNASGTGSLIGQSNLTVNGTATVQRYMGGATWHLTSVPVSGESVQDMVSNNSFSTNDTQYGFGIYNEATDTWTTYTTGTVAAAGNLSPGMGYETNIQSDGVLNFEGGFNTSQVDVSITRSGNGWNLLGNPYPSSLYGNVLADASNNFIDVNTSVMDVSYVALYFWDPSISQYEIINNSSDATYIPVGQAFFVKSKDGGGMASFTTAMQVHQPTAAFKSNTVNANVTLKADNGEQTKTTKFRFIEGTTLGLDPGYDAGLFNGTKDEFVLSSRLIDDNGVSFALQCLPSDDFENAVIPIELNSTTSTVEFSVETSNLPTGIKVYLEDKQDKSFNLLNGEQSYTVQVNIGENTGRFYLHTSQQALDQLSALDDGEYEIIPQAQSSSLLVRGEITEGIRLSIIDLTGRTVFETNVSSSTVNIPSLNNGVYIVKLINGKTTYSQKINWIK